MINERGRESRVNCSICKNPVYDSVDTEKVITCARCVQILLLATQENKISFRDSLLARGDVEGARSVESFLLPEVDTTIATFETSIRLRGANRLVRGSQWGPNGV